MNIKIIRAIRLEVGSIYLTCMFFLGKEYLYIPNVNIRQWKRVKVNIIVMLL